jgi:adenylylsulfate kinase-like enzyme
VAEDLRRVEQPQSQTPDVSNRSQVVSSAGTLTVLAGASGAGKSTLTHGNPAAFASIPVLDPDALVETTISGKSYLHLMQYAWS